MAKDNIKVLIDGNELEYVTFGKGEKILVVLPGLSDGVTTVKGKKLLLSQYYKAFGRHFRVYIFSRKQGLTKGYTTRDMARDQKRAMDTLKIDKAYVMGISQGGMIAQHLAIDYPQVVERLVLGVTVSRQNKTITQSVSRWIDMAKANDSSALTIDTMELTYTEKTLKKYRPFYFILKKINKPKSFDRFIIQANACITHDTYDNLNKISCKSLIIGGGSDRVVGKNTSKEMAEQIKDSKLIVYDDLGHAAYEEAKEFNNEILNFLLA